MVAKAEIRYCSYIFLEVPVAQEVPEAQEVLEVPGVLEVLEAREVQIVHEHQGFL